ncbi:TonB-linked outer membrane protein, SusC/RagA family [Flavobacterium aquidurense]|uniref:SusC/RagA family protein n=1 Tax=Flavobacterium frigidimaris TaxID=262320 RepID=A0ABX4BPT3_FLAFR|nr:SusC/RagA family TonB-linked outer membrane protein [Flavobacterium frigidimaris]OXA78918.1 SusC/RagA family protein [Flavobacterium frigidimaris]SDZ51316.1 TonB-linked outer membrane protein, SusC/RagA family [Flavobacterium aquidurense]
MNNYSFSKGGMDLYCLIFLGFLLSVSPLSAKNQSQQSNSFSQQHKVQGTVTDGTNPLPGVTIAIKNKKNNAVISDYSGQFSLTCSPNDTLIVSYIGFKTALISVQGRSLLNIVLSYDTTTLQEVRVNAGYYSVKESERTGSIARITSKDIETQPVTNVLATMQGRMAGVSITQTTGVPGGGFDIKIRGQNSLRTDANAPLYIIDGVPFSSEPIGYNQTNTTYPGLSSPLNSINPDNIESIEILKDADATAIYGSRGANGVVLITTKKGKEGKTRFTLTASTGAGKVTKFMDLMNTQQYLAMRKQAFINDGLANYNPSDYDINGTWDQNRYTNWQKTLIGNTAQINDLHGTLTGGSEKTQFLLSGSYRTESTVFIGDFLYKKGGSHFSLNHRSDDSKFRLTFSAGYTLQDNDMPASDFTSVSRILVPNAPALYNQDGTLNWAEGTWENPLGNLFPKVKSKTNDLVANTVLSYELLPGLVLKSSLGYTNLSTTETRTWPSSAFNPAANVPSSRSGIYYNNTKRSSWIAEPQISWDKDLLGGKLGVLLGSTFQSQTTERLYQYAEGFSSNSLIYNLAAATYIKINLNDETQYKYQAFFARLNYNYQQRYILNFTFRRDGSSRFSPENRFSNFGAVGAAWLFSSEEILKNSSWLSFGKIRSSYGITGNDQIGDYQFLNTYTTSGVNYNGVIGLQPSRLYNPNFGWETNKKFEIAAELGFLHDRIFLTAAWYQNRSSNQLTGIPLPGTTGFTTLQANLDATVENKGTELTLRTVNLNTGNFNWTTSLNLTFARNKLLKFPGLESSPYSQKYRIGKPLNIALLYQYKGVDPQTGLHTFEDLNADGRISFPEDQQVVTDLNPKYFGGLQNQLTYKKWKLDFLFQFVSQKNRAVAMENAGMMLNQPSRMIDSWKNTGDNSKYQIYTTGINDAALTGDYLFSGSTAAFEDTSFMRLKNIALSYDVPLNLKETQCRIMLQGQNLLTFTKYKDGDPEFISYGYLPPLKVISAAVQLTF